MFNISTLFDEGGYKQKRPIVVPKHWLENMELKNQDFGQVKEKGTLEIQYCHFR